MAGLGIGPDDFALFEIDDPEERAEAVERVLHPKLQLIGAHLASGLSRVAGADLFAHLGKTVRRRGAPPEEAFVAFCRSDKGYRTDPYLALLVTRGLLHARVVVKTGADRSGAMREALTREAGNLARKGKPFRQLRPFMGWDYEELPELAPAHSAAFWQELADELAPAAQNGGIDVGVVWPVEEARSLSVGDVLGAFRDLAPLYKLLAHAA
ncbi:DUF1054 family protein [Anaeromyxobacter paludicola]|uniref:Uncharacterized protein n=1 Tax=Anaeromyxobacter paludicola TaxID=2918171 RepID=A0ABM7XB41_9BACT|nr:DUF1054 family protein [Anaeromyxobacter paludicola]BDG09077.1 hypothetical protein AMPC_21900 [Anaeromyxobacter paludicola]